METLSGADLSNVAMAPVLPGMEGTALLYSPQERLNSPEERIERYRRTGQEVTRVILDHQHPVTGLYPAATRDRFDGPHHYDHSWTRDTALVALGILNATQYSEDPATQAVRQAVGDGLGKNLDLYSTEPWASAFTQAIGHDEARNITYLTQSAPPIHMQGDGSHCEWYAQNQPDSWGEVLLATGAALKLGAFELTEKRMETIKNITTYLNNIHAETFKGSTMWEAGEVYSPASVSNAIMIRAGLRKISPFLQDEQGLAQRTARSVGRIDAFVQAEYPRDYTVPSEHYSKTDLATLVAMVADENPPIPSISRYFLSANKELFDGQYPGKKRWVGDRYFNSQEYSTNAIGTEAVWPMGHLLESILYLRRANTWQNKGRSALAEQYAAKGLAKLDKVLNDADKYGYYPELFVPPAYPINPAEHTVVDFKANGNDLLWNRALVAEACALGEKVLVVDAA